MKLKRKKIAACFIVASLALGPCASHAMIKKIKKVIMTQKQNDKMLFKHCRSGNLQEVKNAIELGANIHATCSPDSKKYSPMTTLNYAFFYKKYKIAEYLSTKVDPYIIATKILEYHYIKLFKLLEKIGLDVTKKLNFAPYSGLSMLDAAFLVFKNYQSCDPSRHYKIIDYLISKNVPMYGNKKNYLLMAARDNNLNAVKYLVEHGVDLKAKSKGWLNNEHDSICGLSALDIILQRLHNHGTRYTKKLDVAEYLIRKNVLLYNGTLSYYLYDAFQNCQTNIFNYLIKNGAKTSSDMLKQLKDTNEFDKDRLGPEEIKAQEEMLQYFEKMVRNHKQVMKAKKSKDIKKLIELCNKSYTSAYSIQIALPILAKSPEIKKIELKNLYKKIPFNETFINKDDFKYARIFAVQENIRDINGLTIHEARILYGNIEQVISNKFPVTTAWRQINKNQLMDLVGKNKTIGQNKKYHQNFINMAYINYLLNKEWKIDESKKVNMPPEVSSQIASFLDNESLKEIVMEKK
ncbi:hypothetical protein ACFLYA_02450 [Candidatus Dependentiae bacterium]